MPLHLQAMSGVEEHADLGTNECGGEIADFSLKRRLVQVEAIDDLKAVRPQRRRHVGRVVPGIGQLAGVLVGRVADDQRDALAGMRNRADTKKQEDDGGPQHGPYSLYGSFPIFTACQIGTRRCCVA